MATRTEREEAKTKLREMLAPGSRIYTVLRHRSASGMSRSISLVVVNPVDKSADRIDLWAARAMDDRIDQNGFACAQDCCLSNDHSNGAPRWHATDAAPQPFHKDGGYAFRQEWM